MYNLTTNHICFRFYLQSIYKVLYINFDNIFWKYQYLENYFS